MFSHCKKYCPLVFLFALIYFLFPGDTFAQKFLALDKSGKIKRIRFYVTDNINVRLTDENFFRSGCINEINDTSFFLDGAIIPVSKVEAIRVTKNKSGSAFLHSLSVMLPVAGVFFLGITAANSLINNDYPLVPANMYYVSGGMIAAGLLLRPLTFRVYRINHHPLKIIDVSISAQ